MNCAGHEKEKAKSCQGEIISTGGIRRKAINVSAAESSEIRIVKCFGYLFIENLYVNMKVKKGEKPKSREHRGKTELRYVQKEKESVAYLSTAKSLSHNLDVGL